MKVVFGLPYVIFLGNLLVSNILFLLTGILLFLTAAFAVLHSGFLYIGKINPALIDKIVEGVERRMKR